MNIKKQSPFVFALLTLTIVLSACAPVQPAASSPSLEGSMWNLSGFRTADSLIPPVSKTQVTLDFEEGQVSGSSGCNGYGANYTLEGNNISFSTEGFVSTLMFCDPQEIMDQETRFLTWIQNAETVALEGEQLIIRTTEGDLVFDKAQHAALEGTDWQLNGIVEGDAVVNTVVDESINIRFENGQATGSSGCNQFFADYTLEGEKLTLSGIGGTKIACEEEVGQREATFLNALAQVAAYQIERSTLKLLDASGNALMSFSVDQ